ncbi:MAG: hypothetical protein ETSY2_27790 [Candidatus Entotheonella gemina]|uniref:Uncharacterized protein n=1 Tax=Candidatus Entotheonella gemina TaxID=1429439 RepID=W4M365_9BACT|nr:MAG: hypothetical protein ETSY2_27790 [Candidatus Entotheonella gemina]
MLTRAFSRPSWLVFFGARFLLTLPAVHADQEPWIFIPGFGTEICAPEVENPWPNASASIDIDREDGTTEVEIEVENVAPNTLYTVWLLHEELNPLTVNRPFTSLVNPSDIAGLATYTPASALSPTAIALGLAGDDGSGSVNATNGFRTDDEGEGEIELALNFPLIKGACQYQEFDGSLKAIATGNTQDLGGFRLVIVSHCADDRAHGLVDQDTGTDETWFIY